MSSNKQRGNSFERELCELLAENGFWAHNFAQNRDGQPADIIAVKFYFHCLIDCKLITNRNEGFPLSRWEENQRMSMALFHSRGWYQSYLALKLPDGTIRMVGAATLLGLESKGKHSIPFNDISKYTMRFDEWLGVVYEANRRWLSPNAL